MGTCFSGNTSQIASRCSVFPSQGRIARLSAGEGEGHSSKSIAAIFEERAHGRSQMGGLRPLSATRTQSCALVLQVVHIYGLSGRFCKGNFRRKMIRRAPDYSSNLCPPKIWSIWLFKGVFWGLLYKKKNRKQPKTPLKKSYRSYFRRAQIRWVIWRSSNDDSCRRTLDGPRFARIASDLRFASCSADKGSSSGTLTRFPRIKRFARICESICANRAI